MLRSGERVSLVLLTTTRGRLHIQNCGFDKHSINIKAKTGIGHTRDIMSPIYVYIWFDIEDYVTKESDDLPLVAFQILEKYGVPVTCKMVAEKVRRLEENGRADVISAIARHDVGFHLDTHSQHPTLYEYLSNLDVLSGADQFLAHEGIGLEKVKQTFSRIPSCFGHPGPTWAPHVYPALAKSNIPVYLDETSILTLDDEPYWYCGILNLNGANRNFISFDYTFERENGLEVLKRKFKKLHDRLQTKGGGAVSVLFHLHTAINKKFWDEVNFAHGKNTPKENYRRPPAQPTMITERAWRSFEEFVTYMSSLEDVKFITASDAAKIYQRPGPLCLNHEQLLEVAKHFRKSPDFMTLKGTVISPAEAFHAVTKALIDQPSEHVQVGEPLGPMDSFRSTGKRRLNAKDFLAAAKKALDHIDRQGCLPTSISVGDCAQLNPHDFLATACGLLPIVLSGKPLPEQVRLSTTKPPNQNYISAANFKKACKWSVLRRDFEGSKILEQIKLQAWTLKPARAVEPPP